MIWFVILILFAEVAGNNRGTRAAAGWVDPDSDVAAHTSPALSSGATLSLVYSDEFEVDG